MMNEMDFLLRKRVMNNNAIKITLKRNIFSFLSCNKVFKIGHRLCVKTKKNE